MTLRRISIFAATLVAMALSAWHGVVAAVERAFHVIVETIAGPARPVVGFDAPLAAGHAPTYDAPPIHFLRHEAGTPQRAAHRHI